MLAREHELSHGLQACKGDADSDSAACMLELHQTCNAQAGWHGDFEAHSSLLLPFTDWAESAQVELNKRADANCVGAACFEGLIASG